MLFISLVFAILNNVNAGTVINDGHLCSKETSTMTCDDYYRVYTCDESTGTTGTNCKSSDNKKICVDNANGWSTNQCTRVSYGWTIKNWNCWEGHQWASDLRCSKCAKGRYRGYTGSANVAKMHNQPLFCSACPEGTYSNQEGLALCDNCLAGKYQTSCEQGSTDGVTTNAGCRQCKTCPQGWWQDQPKASTCKQCGVGTYNDQNGRTNENADCHECQAGELQVLSCCCLLVADKQIRSLPSLRSIYLFTDNYFFYSFLHSFFPFIKVVLHLQREPSIAISALPVKLRTILLVV